MTFRTTSQTPTNQTPYIIMMCVHQQLKGYAGIKEDDDFYTEYQVFVSRMRYVLAH